MTLWKAACASGEAPTDGGNPGRKARGEISQVTGQRGRMGGRRRRLLAMSRHARGVHGRSRHGSKRDARQNASVRPACRCWARAWCRSPATTCRSSIPPASSPSICIRAKSAGLFDVSHMGQALLSRAGHARRAALEALVPGRRPQSRARAPALHAVAQRDWRHPRRPDGHAAAGRRGAAWARRQRRAQGGGFRASAEAAAATFAWTCCTTAPCSRCRARRPPRCSPSSLPGVAAMAFMTWREFDWNGVPLFVSRSGYTGEDGYEISVPADEARAFADKLLADDRGHADRPRRSRFAAARGRPLPLRPRHRRARPPIEAGLAWSIQKRRREEGGFPGAERIQAELKNGPARKRVGLELAGNAPAREGAEITARRRPQNRPRHLRRLRAESRAADRDGLCRERFRALGTDARSHRARQAARSARCRKCLSFRTAIIRG